MPPVLPPFALQAAAVTHPAQVFRRTLKAMFRYSGVVGPADLEVTPVAGQRAVSVAAGEAVILGTENALRQGAYHCLNDAAVQLAIAAADATNPRYDRIVAQVRDAEFSGANNDWILTVIQGAAAAAPVEPALPANCLELARLRVNANVATFATTDLLTRRPLARSSGGLLGSVKSIISGASAVAEHDTGYQVQFVMPLLAPGQRIEAEVSGSNISWSANVPDTTGVYTRIRDQNNVVVAEAFDWMGITTSIGPAPRSRGTLDNTNYPAGTLVTLKLATASTNVTVTHFLAAGAAAPIEMTVKVI